MYRNFICTIYGLWTLVNLYNFVVVDAAEFTPMRYMSKNPIICTGPNNEKCYIRNQQNIFEKNIKKISGMPSKEDKPFMGNSGTLKRPSSYVRFGKRFLATDDLHSLEKRASSYLRFGKRDEILDEINDVPLEKRPSSYVRFGKRPSSYVRFGKRSLIDDINNEYNDDKYDGLVEE